MSEETKPAFACMYQDAGCSDDARPCPDCGFPICERHMPEHLHAHNQREALVGDFYEQRIREASVPDPINHPAHYTSHPSGVECIQITEHMDFLTGNAMKYLWRAGQKEGASRLEDLKKCAWYVQRAIQKEES